MIGVNVKGVILTAKAFAQHLTGIGKAGSDANIINMSSQAGRKDRPELTVYSASKAAVMGFSRSLAVELALFVRTNTICPAIFGMLACCGGTGRLKAMPQAKRAASHLQNNTGRSQDCRGQKM